MKRKLLHIKLLAMGLLALTQGNAQTTFSYTGAMQTYTVPVGVTSIRLECWGAQGSGGNGGNGGYAKGEMTVTPGQVLNVYVGGQTGYNGGGLGHAAINRNGGGASDVRVSPYALANRVIVAGGGGGGGQTDVGIRNGGTGGGGTVGSNYAGGGGGDGYGGNGGPGGLNGGTGNTSCHSGGAGGGGLNSGGAASCNTCYTSSCGQAGSLGQGGNGDVWENGICYNSYGGTNGGGGGYYGGGGSSVGNCGGGGGGGGSSWVGTLTNTTLTGGIRAGNGQIVITVLTSFAATVTQSSTIQCFGQSTAALTAVPVGGTGPYAYAWAPTGGNAATASGLGAGTYTVTITDNGGNTATQTFTITQPTTLASVSSSTGTACFGGSTGVAAVVASGGTAPYTYAWSTGGTSTSISNLAAGVYSCTVTCSNGCTTTASTTVTQPSAITISPMQTNISCNGGSNGSAMAMVSGGTPGYTYSWSPSGGNASSASSLSVGSYTCTVTDANACTSTQTFNITAPSAVAASAVAQPVLCNGGGTTVNVSGSGGVSPYSGTGTFTAGAGTFTYTVTDANGCSSTTSVTITEPAAIVTSVSQTNVTCNGGADGSIDLTVNGGTAPFTFDWNSGTYTTEDLTGLSAGTYAGVLTDANGCPDSGTITITEPNAIIATLAIANDTTCSADGAFALTGATPAGGVFSGPGVSGGSFDPSVAGAGVHVITYIYTDSSGCTASATDSIYVDVCTGTQVYGSATLVAIYPNPNNGTFSIQVASMSDVNIYDAQGKLVYAQKVQPNVQHTLNLSENGVYMINVTNANGERTSQRVMVTK